MMMSSAPTDVSLSRLDKMSEKSPGKQRCALPPASTIRPMTDTSANLASGDDRTTITAIRHGESKVTVDRVIGGRRSCRGLSVLGRTQARRLRDRLSGDDTFEPDAMLVSDFLRAIETADIVLPALADGVAPCPLDQWQDFGEHDPGPDIDGMTFDEYVGRYGTPDWNGDPDVEIFPGGETTRQFHRRVASGLERLREEFAGRHVVVVCHGGVIDAMFRLILRLPLTATFELESTNTALTTFSGPASRSGDSSSLWRLDRFNDAAHLVGLPTRTPRPG